jgi:hypothetical protein
MTLMEDGRGKLGYLSSDGVMEVVDIHKWRPEGSRLVFDLETTQQSRSIKYVRGRVDGNDIRLEVRGATGWTDNLSLRSEAAFEDRFRRLKTKMEQLR